MENDFMTYTIYIVLITIFLIICFFLFFNKKKKKVMSQKPVDEAIECGTVSILFDNFNNAMILPYVKDKYGVGRALDQPQSIKYPYTTTSLGQIVKIGMNLCKEGKAGTGKEIMDKLGLKDWGEFSKGKRSISVYYDKKVGIVINSTTRFSGGAYKINSQRRSKAMVPTVSDKDFGERILEELKSCKS